MLGLGDDRVDVQGYPEKGGFFGAKARILSSQGGLVSNFEGKASRLTLEGAVGDAMANLFWRMCEFAAEHEPEKFDKGSGQWRA